MDNQHPPVLLVDGSSFVHRAYHGMPERRNKHGESIHAVLGIRNMLAKTCRMAGSKEIIFMLDADGVNFRHDIYPEYKANRDPAADDLKLQIEMIVELILILGFPLLRLSGVEADDVIGTLANRFSLNGRDVVIATCDKDMSQLVNDRVTLLNTMTGDYGTAQSITEKYGVTPNQFIDYLAMIGDKSDNIPGVAGIGKKTAADLLSRFGSIDGIIAGKDEIKGKLGEKIRANIDDLYLCQKLTTIKCDVDLSSFNDDYFNRKLPMDPEDMEFFADRYGVEIVQL